MSACVGSALLLAVAAVAYLPDSEWGREKIRTAVEGAHWLLSYRDLARESGFKNVKDLLEIAKHGRGDKVYLIRFHYLRPGAWDSQPASVKM